MLIRTTFPSQLRTSASASASATLLITSAPALDTNDNSSAQSTNLANAFQTFLLPAYTPEISVPVTPARFTVLTSSRSSVIRRRGVSRDASSPVSEVDSEPPPPPPAGPALHSLTNIMVMTTETEELPRPSPGEWNYSDSDVTIPRLDVPIPRMRTTSTPRGNDFQSRTTASDGLLNMSDLVARGVALSLEEREYVRCRPGEHDTRSGVPNYSVEEYISGVDTRQ